MEISKDAEIKLLYNIKDKKADYYIHGESENSDNYISIKEQIKSNKSATEENNKNNDAIVVESSQYTFSTEDVDKVTDVNGKEISISKFDQTFIELKDESEEIKIDLNGKDKELKSHFEEGIDIFIPAEELITKKNEKLVDKAIKKVEDTKNEMKKAAEEVKKKKEEAKKKAAEEAEKKEKKN